ncbi:ATP-dependent RNA helicase DHX8 [Apiospora arundinis]|uniref:ATP-dependent RNA helicase DHX8 n=1 Tax=Apiospora arundinis TaxID=335852 RepID=A0ABR2JMZ4_9PEZI
MSPPPYRQIRALHDGETITVYQAYNADIAAQAVAQQRLDASPRFKKATRMTWVKPSWCWMMYRAGYSHKDRNQERVLALRMRHGHFLELLRRGVLSHNMQQRSTTTTTAAEDDDVGDSKKEGEKKNVEEEEVRIQWDPERSPRLEKLDYRSIQIGVPAALQARWVGEWIVSIEDVTERAHELKRVLDEEKTQDGSDAITDDELVDRGLLPRETEFVVPRDIQEILGMTELVKKT